MIPPAELDDAPGRRRPQNVAVVALALLVSGALIWGLLQPAPDRGNDGKAPDFSLPRVKGEGSLSSGEIKGSPVVLNFWASWCGPCRDETPLLEKMWRKHRDDGLVIVGVNTMDSLEGAQEFVEELGITYPVVHDADERLTKDLGVTGLPQTFFINTEWEIAQSESGLKIGTTEGTAVLGAISLEALEEGIEQLLAGGEASPSP